LKLLRPFYGARICHPILWRALLGLLPLIRGEDGCAYNELCARIAAAVKPQDFLEEI
jgi:hypothetical protein